MIFTVLGGRGFIGSHLCAYLKSQGHHVLVPEPSELDEKTDYGHVIYCIGLTADFRHRPFDTMYSHIGLIEKTLKLIKFDSFLYLSSTRLYHGAECSKEDCSILVNPQNPSDLYNISKLAGESLCLHCGLENVRVVRLSNVIGYDPNSQNLFSELVKEGLKGHVYLQANFDSEKDFILIDDVIILLEKIAISGKENFYNVASGANTKYGVLAKQIAKITNAFFSVSDDAELQLFSPVSNDRIKAEFNFHPRDILSFLPDLIAQYKAGDFA